MIRLIKCEKGVAAVEFAFFLPILVLLLVGIVDYGMYLHQKMTLQELSRAASEFVLQGGDPDDIVESVYTGSTVEAAALADGRTVDFDTITECECEGRVPVDCSGPGSTCGSGDYVRTFLTVTVTSTFTPILPYPGMADGLTLEGYTSLQYRE